MSVVHYPTRLVWYGPQRGGLARHGGVTVELRDRPAVLAPDLAEIDYLPAVRVEQVRPMAGAWRDMTRAEAEQVTAWLERLVFLTHQAVTGADPS